MPQSLVETNMTVLVTPAEDGSGTWIAHCLNLDVLTQGDTLAHAFSMAREAVELVVQDDLERGLDPLERSCATPDRWSLAFSAFQGGHPIGAIEDTASINAAVGMLHVVVPRDALPEHARPDMPAVEMLPAPWQVAALKNGATPSAHC